MRGHPSHAWSMLANIAYRQPAVAISLRPSREVGWKWLPLRTDRQRSPLSAGVFAVVDVFLIAMEALQPCFLESNAWFATEYETPFNRCFSALNDPLWTLKHVCSTGLLDARCGHCSSSLMVSLQCEVLLSGGLVAMFGSFGEFTRESAKEQTLNGRYYNRIMFYVGRWLSKIVKKIHIFRGGRYLSSQDNRDCNIRRRAA